MKQYKFRVLCWIVSLLFFSLLIDTKRVYAIGPCTGTCFDASTHSCNGQILAGAICPPSGGSLCCTGTVQSIIPACAEQACGSGCCEGTIPWSPPVPNGPCICVIPGTHGTSPDVVNGPSIAGGCIDTAIGCIPVLDSEGNEAASFFLQWGVGIAGGIATVMIGISSFIIMTASGDPRKLQSGKELLTAAITGLLLLVFSAFILRFAGTDILQIFD